MHPALVRWVLLPLHERAKRAPTFALLRQLERSQWEDPSVLRDRQIARLREFVRFAYENTGYYRRLLDEHELPPHRIQSFTDFARIPPLTRDLLRRHFNELQSPLACTHGVQRIASGGSTGEPVALLRNMHTGFFEAARYRAHRWFGSEPGAREIVLWGSPIEISKQDRLRRMRDWLINSHLLSAFDLGETALARYATVIARYRPNRMYGYASAFYLLARYLERAGWQSAWKPTVIFPTAEPLFDFQRRTIAKVFGCPIAVEYGARDAGLIANECPRGGLHIPAEGMVIEIDSPTPDGVGEIITTNLLNPAMPILRYRTGDVGKLAHVPCPCGRSLPCLESVDGRRTDFLVTPSGRVLHALSVIYVLREAPRVQAFQVVQEAVDHVVVHIVGERDFSASDRTQLSAQLRELLGPEMNVRIETVAEIGRAPSGKFRYVISRVADDHLDRLLAGVRPATASALST